MDNRKVITVIPEKRKKNDHLGFLSGSPAWVVVQAGEVQSDNWSLTEPTKIRVRAIGTTGIRVAKYQRGTITQRNSSRFWGSLESCTHIKLHLCRVKLHETGQRTTTEKRAITRKILETTQASAMFGFQPVSMGSSNECPRNLAENLEKLHLGNIISLTLGESLL